MAGVGKVAERVPGWVERLLIPALESRVRSIVKEEAGHLDKANEARFDAVEARFDAMEATLDAKLEGIATRIDSLEKGIPILQDIADLKARLAVIEKRTAG